MIYSRVKKRRDVKMKTIWRMRRNDGLSDKELIFDSLYLGIPISFDLLAQKIQWKIEFEQVEG